MTPANLALLIFSIVMNVISCGILRNEFCKKEMKSNADLLSFNTLSSLLSMIALLGIGALTGTLSLPSLYTLALGAAFGVVTALCAILNMLALEKGPLSYTTVILSCSMILPSLSGWALYGETITVWQGIGVVFLLFSFVFSVDRKNDRMGASVRWLLLCLGAFLFSGIIGIMQKIHQNSPHKGELSSFLIVAFAVSAGFSALFAFYYRYRKKEPITVCGKSKIKRFALFGAISGVGVALCNQINLYLSGVMDAMVFYPAVNGGPMSLGALAGMALWKERLSRRQWMGMAAGAVSLMLLCNLLS